MPTAYELLYIVPATFTDEELSAVESQVKALLEKQRVTIDSTARLGKFRFTYPIKKFRYGHYIQVRMSAEPQQMREIESALRITTHVLRFLLLRQEEVGSDKFNMIQFTEVNIEAKEQKGDQFRKRPEAARRGAVSSLRRPSKTNEELKSAVAALGATQEVVPPSLSTEELEKKIDAALSEEKA